MTETITIAGKEFEVLEVEFLRKNYAWEDLPKATRLRIGLAERDAEISRLKAELELRDKVIEQATKDMFIEGNSIYAKGKSLNSAKAWIGSEITDPELYVHLAGRGEGCLS